MKAYLMWWMSPSMSTDFLKCCRCHFFKRVALNAFSRHIVIAFFIQFETKSVADIFASNVPKTVLLQNISLFKITWYDFSLILRVNYMLPLIFIRLENIFNSCFVTTLLDSFCINHLRGYRFVNNLFFDGRQVARKRVQHLFLIIPRCSANS